MLAGALDRDSILELLRGTPPLVDGYSDLSQQLQPNGFDLTLGTISTYDHPRLLGESAAPEGGRQP